MCESNDESKKLEMSVIFCMENEDNGWETASKSEKDRSDFMKYFKITRMLNISIFFESAQIFLKFIRIKAKRYLHTYLDFKLRFFFIIQCKSVWGKGNINLSKKFLHLIWTCLQLPL